MHKVIIVIFALACILAVGAQDSSCDAPHESVRCVESCPPPATCENRGRVYECPIQFPNDCTQQCVCDVDYYRNSKGDCITSAECGSECNGPHESVRCVGQCPPPQTCANRHLAIGCAVSETCTTQCVCDLPYYRNSKGECVTSQECGTNP